MSTKNKTTITASIKPKDGAQLFVDWSLIDDNTGTAIRTRKGLKLTEQGISKNGHYSLVADVKGKKGDKLERTAVAKGMVVYPSETTSHTLPNLEVSESRDQYTFIVVPK
jgi:hypothetical protein